MLKSAWKTAFSVSDNLFPAVCSVAILSRPASFQLYGNTNYPSKGHFKTTLVASEWEAKSSFASSSLGRNDKKLSSRCRALASELLTVSFPP